MKEGADVVSLPPSSSLTASLPSPAWISTRTLAIAAGPIALRRNPCVSQVWKQTSAAFTNSRFSHFTGAALHYRYFVTWVESTWEGLRDAGMGASAMPTAVLMSEYQPQHHQQPFMHSPDCSGLTLIQPLKAHWEITQHLEIAKTESGRWSVLATCVAIQCRFTPSVQRIDLPQISIGVVWTCDSGYAFPRLAKTQADKQQTAAMN